MSAAHEADKRELDRRIRLILDGGYPGNTLMPGDLGRLACGIAGLDTTYRPKLRNDPKTTSKVQPQPLRIMDS